MGCRTSFGPAAGQWLIQWKIPQSQNPWAIPLSCVIPLSCSALDENKMISVQSTNVFLSYWIFSSCRLWHTYVWYMNAWTNLFPFFTMYQQLLRKFKMKLVSSLFLFENHNVLENTCILGWSTERVHVVFFVCRKVS